MTSMGQRASNDDRMKVVAELEQHTAEGRLTLDEFTSRVDRVYRAATYGELAQITGDLPRPVPARDDQRHLLLALAIAIATIAVIALSLRLW